MWNFRLVCSDECRDMVDRAKQVTELSYADLVRIAIKSTFGNDHVFNMTFPLLSGRLEIHLR